MAPDRLSDEDVTVHDRIMAAKLGFILSVYGITNYRIIDYPQGIYGKKTYVTPVNHHPAHLREIIRGTIENPIIRPVEVRYLIKEVDDRGTLAHIEFELSLDSSVILSTDTLLHGSNRFTGLGLMDGFERIGYSHEEISQDEGRYYLT